MAGVPFEPLERLATPDILRQARNLVEQKEEFEAAIREAGEFFDSGEHLLSREAFRELRSAVRARRLPKDLADQQPAVFLNYKRRRTRLLAAESEFQTGLERAVALAGASLVEAARMYLPRQLIFNARRCARAA